MSQPHIAKDPVAKEQGNTGISAAAHAYQIAMEQQSAAPPARVADSSTDVVMTESTPMELERVEPPPILPPVRNAPSPTPVPGRTGTPQRTNGDANSRATSVHPEVSAIPKEAPPNGAPTRQYLNGQVTGPLLEGMKAIAKQQPKDPLRVLGEFLVQKSRELEGT